MTSRETALFGKVTNAFVAHFGASPEVIACAPGRVNLIGEHTDYNDGFVLPCAIGLGTMVAAKRRDDNQVRIVAIDFDSATDAFDLNKPLTANVAQPWADYVRGTIDALLTAGYSLTGADLVISGNIPKGAGLSSSASLEVAVGRAMLALAGIEIDLTELARFAQAAECDFVGTKCGIMDQLVSARGKAGHALLIDCRSLSLTDVPVPEHVALMIVHSGVTRGLVDGHYNERRRQCETAAKEMRVTALRDADLAMLESAGLDDVTYRRARHVITENRRTLEAADALSRSDLQMLGMLMAQSHVSMRDDFQITVPAIDGLVAVLQSTIGEQGGARMTGGGFGGACVAILPASRVAEVTAAVEENYQTPAGQKPLVLVERPGSGVALV